MRSSLLYYQSHKNHKHHSAEGSSKESISTSASHFKSGQDLYHGLRGIDSQSSHIVEDQDNFVPITGETNEMCPCHGPLIQGTE